MQRGNRNKHDAYLMQTASQKAPSGQELQYVKGSIKLFDCFLEFTTNSQLVRNVPLARGNSFCLFVHLAPAAKNNFFIDTLPLHYLHFKRQIAGVRSIT